MKCAKCGVAASEGTVFCTECGARIPDGPGAPDVSPAAEAAPEAPSSGQKTDPEPRPPILDLAAEPEAPARAGTVPGSPISGALKMQVLAPLAGAPRAKTYLAAGTVVDGKYSIVRVIGEGGMGVVYLARDVHTGLEVVLKSIRPELAHRKDVRERTLAEGRALAQIDHVNVVHLNAVVAHGDDLWLVMQYIDGESLEDVIARHTDLGRPMPLAEALGMFRQMLLGIAAAHAEGIVHRDLKPANILIRRKDGVAKVTDFGISKIEVDARAGRGVTKGIIGSLWYMSPEQVTGRRDLDKRVDIYALGIVLYEMLVGHVPFDAASDIDIMRMHATAPMPLVSKARADIPPAVDDVIQRACAKDRDQRFASAAEFFQALDGLDASAQVVVPERTPPPRPATTVGATTNQGAALPTTAPGRGRAWLPLALLGLVVIGGGGGAALYASGVLDGAPGKTRVTPASTAPPHDAPGATATAAETATPATPPRAPLEALEGAWIGNGRELDAVYVGEALEFRVRHGEQFRPQDYQTGEVRFALRPLAGQTAVFAVEEHMRPIPPSDKTFAPSSRGTCQEVWTDAGGKPLRATWDGTQLSVEFAKIEPKSPNFITKKNEIVSCLGLRKLGTAKVASFLTRQQPAAP